MTLVRPSFDTATETITDLLKVERMHRRLLALMTRASWLPAVRIPDHFEFIGKGGRSRGEQFLVGKKISPRYTSNHPLLQFAVITDPSTSTAVLFSRFYSHRIQI